MANENHECPFCEETCERTVRPFEGDVRFECDCCGEYFVTREDFEDFLDKKKWREENHAERIGALLAERRGKGLSAVFLMFRGRDQYPVEEMMTLHVEDLLADWPESVYARLDRALCNLARQYPDVGNLIQLNTSRRVEFLLFARDPKEERYNVKALVKHGWIENPGDHLHDYGLEITPKGWSRVEELAGGAERRRNPAFVAMWFGGSGDASKERMSVRFENVIRLACRTQGWNAQRVDLVEHNDSVIDRIVAMIRVAPFVIADLCENNDGVYYEAGFARGCGVPVIYLVREGTSPHFDVSGVNQVRWSSDDELRVRLGNRVLGTMGRGPHKIVSAQQTPPAG